MEELTPIECIRIYGKHRFVEYGPVYNSIYAELIGHNIMMDECTRCSFLEEKWIKGEAND